MDFNIHRNFWHVKQISRTRFTSRCRSEVFRVSPFILTSDKGKPKVPLDREAILLSYWGFLESAVRSHRNSSHSFWVGRRIEWITYCYREWVVESGSHTVVQSWVENWWTLVGRSLFKQARKKTKKQKQTLIQGTHVSWVPWRTYLTTERTNEWTASSGFVDFSGRRNSIPWQAASNSMARTKTKMISC